MNRTSRWALAAACVAPFAFATLHTPPAAGWKLIGWNDLGMHCMDSDYEVLSILPPFNTIHAHLVDPNGNLVTSPQGITVTYEGVADPSGSINTTSVGKTNFWTYAQTLYGGSSTPNVGLAGSNMPGPGNPPQPMSFDAALNQFSATGIPLTPFDDLGHKRTYPLMQLVARNAANAILATTQIVLPISDEMDCSLCHGSGTSAAAKPSAGWVYDRNQIHDYRLNILRTHDDKQAANPTYQSALATAGYAATGLYDTAKAGTPILCARCHASNALPGTGIAGIAPLTSSMHWGHATVLDPMTGMTLQSSANRSSCYRCHPGSDTRCLRGVMGNSVATNGSRAIQCQNCHGSMITVGDPARTGWLEEPACQSCHTGTALNNNGQIRYTSVFEANGAVRQAVDQTFATNPNTPAQGFNLYRFSQGHGGLQCEACHGSTHAEYPAAHGNDNLQVNNLQGHVGTVVECASCHATSPNTTTGGPHGMHPVGQPWVDRHHDIANNGRHTQCRVCHGTDYRGTVLSVMQADRTLRLENGAMITLWKGSQVGCYTCHQGPTNGDPNPNRRPVVQNVAASTATAAVNMSINASDPNGNPLALRIVHQPDHGRVALNGSTATYYPEPGFAGEDVFNFAAWDGSIDSNLGVGTVTRLATWVNYGIGYPGNNNTTPSLGLDNNPVLGSTVSLVVGNSAGSQQPGVLIFSPERAALTTPVGGLLLTEPSAVVPLTVPTGGASLPAAIPNAPVLVGASLYFQAALVDPGARYQVALSQGLCMTLGR